MKGILLANTGSPQAPSRRAVRAYLAQFLSDRRVIDLPRLLWLPLLHGIILNVRPQRSARLYQRIWTENGSPLVVNSLRLADALQTRLEDLRPGCFRVEAGMRYEAPSIAAALRSLRAAGCSELIILPLFPQYSSTTTASMFDAVFDELRRWPRVPRLRLIDGYHDHPAYIRAITESVRDVWQEGEPPDRLLLTFHGIPRRYVKKGDPYEAQCHETAARMAAALELSPDFWRMTFQSRFGAGEWLRPATVDALKELAGSGYRRVDIVAPGFAVDCLETLDEIANEARHAFLHAGGGKMRYIPALNADDRHVETLFEVLYSTSP